MGTRKKITVVGAGFYGSTTAQRLAEYDIFDTVVLTDIIEGKPEGLALDLNQSRPIEGLEPKLVGVTPGPNGEGYAAIEGSAIIWRTVRFWAKPATVKTATAARHRDIERRELRSFIVFIRKR